MSENCPECARLREELNRTSQEAWVKHMLQMARDGEVATLRKERDEARRQASWQPCSVCVGEPLPSGKKCVCDGFGTASGEAHGLRGLLLSAEKERDAALAECEALRRDYDSVRERLGKAERRIDAYGEAEARWSEERGVREEERLGLVMRRRAERELLRRALAELLRFANYDALCGEIDSALAEGRKP